MYDSNRGSCRAATGSEVGSATAPEGGGGAAETTIAASPLFPSLVAVIVADPVATPETSPVLETDATAALELAQVTARPVSSSALASYVTALSCCALRVATVEVVGVTTTSATATVVALVRVVSFEQADKRTSEIVPSILMYGMRM
jgi:hypothetical protein